MLPGFRSFDGIIGDDTLKKLGAVIDRRNHTLTIQPGITIPLKNRTLDVVHITEGPDAPETARPAIESLIAKYAELFEPLSIRTKIKTSVEAEINISVDGPIYTKSYPYPASMRAEVERQIEELLAEGIIRPSKSPYNSPIWIVPKKPKPSGEKQYRMVIDFKRLNQVTVADAYPIPDINATLASLGGAKYFTTIDLTSGFHQIPMKNSDIPKTAFSTMNGKYEFLRLPFGLKNAPAIFQRMIDDVLKDFIGKICYVYIDDIIVFGKDVDDHLRNVDAVFGRLMDSNLRVNLEKTKFMRTEVEFLGYLITSEGIKPDETKVEAITYLPPPQTLKDLKSFLGMTSYYRKFIRDYAKIAKPLTNLTRGENSQVKANQSRKVRVNLDERALAAFTGLKDLLVSYDVLAFPDFDKPFTLTTDASDYAIGAVLSQGESGKERPIAFISRSLNKTEENYATNEKEMLAIVWALDNLRSYLYGAKRIRILTDHQPLTFALGNRNHNAKLKRWKARIEEYNYELIYTPGKSNVVADALSRLPCQANHLTLANRESDTETASEGDSDRSRTLTAGRDSGTRTRTASEGDTVHSAEQDASDLIMHVEAPLNVFRNQIIIREGKELFSVECPHRGYTRHYINLDKVDEHSLTTVLKERLDPSLVNGIKIPEKFLHLLQEVYLCHFRYYKMRITQRIVQDVNREEMICKIIEDEHKRAHRNHAENKSQILERYYFPKMTSLIKSYTKGCETCLTNKYDRHPFVPELKDTPVPDNPCDILHVDIFEIQGERFLSCLDKFSKFAKFFHIRDKSAVHLRGKFAKIIHYFTAPRMIVTDNERGFVSPMVANYIRALGIRLYQTPVQRSEVNGQVERLHSTILEIYRCLKRELSIRDPKELLYIAVDRYNNTIHSVTKQKPNDIFFNRTQRINYQELTNFKARVFSEVREHIKKNQEMRNLRINKKRKKGKRYEQGDILYVKSKQIKGKEKPLYTKKIVGKDNRVTIQTTEGKRIHKTHIKNIGK